jgi:hypothetical protein
MFLTEAQKNALISQGATIVAGPFANHADCNLHCGSQSFSNNIVTDCGCCNPGGAVSFWQVTFSGFSDGTCTGCSVLNDTFILQYQGSCSWQSEQFTITCGATTVTLVVRLTITFGFNGCVMILDIGNVSGGATVFGPWDSPDLGNPLNCQAANDLTSNTNPPGTDCNGGALVVTISPA